MSEQDVIRRLRQHLPHYSDVSAALLVDEANRQGLAVSDAVALVQIESGFRNIFGHDQGGMYPGQRVTREKVRTMIAHVHNGGTSNGVGLTQLTSLGYLDAAETLGGAHVMRNQLAVGYHALAGFIHAYGSREGFAAYNGGAGGRFDTGPRRYADNAINVAKSWHAALKT